MTFPVPKKIDKSGELTDDESGFILDTTLRPKHRTDASVISFIESFVRCKNIAQASAETGIHNSLGYKYRHRKDIANAIQKIIDKSNVKHGFDASEVLERAKEMMDFDPIHLQNPDGSFKNNLHDIPPEIRRNLKKLKVKNLYAQKEDLNGIKTKIIIGEVIEYDWYDKPKTVEMVGKEKEMFKNTTKVIHDVTKNMQETLLASNKRADKFIEDKKNEDVIDAEYTEEE